MNKEQLLYLRKEVLNKEFERMNDKQKEAVFSINGPLLILAGAGSGKTTVVVNRIANIIKYGNAYQSEYINYLDDEDIEEMNNFLENNVPISDAVIGKLTENPCPAWRILAITFTNKAAGELKARLNKILGPGSDEIWASTFHSTCARILRKDGDRLGYTRHFTIYDSDDSKRVMKQCLKELDIPEKIMPVKSVLNEISRAKDNLLTPEEYKRQNEQDYRLAIVAKAYALYQKELKNANAMDFDDLIVNTVELFTKCPDVLEQYQNRFKYVMVDEYQDTNHAQYVFVDLISRKNGNLCVVGDDDQSIYKFRGATIENILSFEESYPKSKVIRLEQNYRSTQNILDAANSVITNNIGRKGKTLWTANGKGAALSCYTAENEQDEAERIAKVIFDKIALEGYKFSDFAVLYRMNVQSNAIERHFLKAAIPYRIIGGTRFYERAEIRDIIAYLSVINNPADTVRLTRIINKPKRAIGDRTVELATQIANELGTNLFDVICRALEFGPLSRSAMKLTEFAVMIKSLVAAANDGVTSLEELYQLLLEKTDFLSYLKTEYEDAQDRIDNVNELLSNIVNYCEATDEPTLSGFLEDVALLTDLDNYDEEADSVVMMTIHSAKGLEFPIVFLPGMEENIFPGTQSIYNPEEIEEERRLAYVAITRAKKELYFLNTQSRIVFGSTNRNKISRFVEEIPPEMINFERARTYYAPKPSVSFDDFAAPKTSAPTFTSYKPSKTVSTDTYKVGERVSHKTFGEGMILNSTKMGNDYLLEIAFDTVGTKKLMSNFAKLKKV